jgi:hypothetical protein
MKPILVTGSRGTRLQPIDADDAGGTMSMRARPWLRAGLVLLTVLEGGLGIWTLLLPRVFYDHFPTVKLDPPFNEHLFRDFGGASLGITVVLAVAAIVMERRLIYTALAAYLSFAVPHLVFHATHLEHFSPAQAVLLTVFLVVAVAIPLGLLVLVRRGAGYAARPREAGNTALPG